MGHDNPRLCRHRFLVLPAQRPRVVPLSLNSNHRLEFGKAAARRLFHCWILPATGAIQPPGTSTAEVAPFSLPTNPKRASGLPMAAKPYSREPAGFFRPLG